MDVGATLLPVASVNGCALVFSDASVNGCVPLTRCFLSEFVVSNRVAVVVYWVCDSVRKIGFTGSIDVLAVAMSDSNARSSSLMVSFLNSTLETGCITLGISAYLRLVPKDNFEQTTLRGVASLRLNRSTEWTLLRNIGTVFWIVIHFNKDILSLYYSKYFYTVTNRFICATIRKNYIYINKHK